MEYNKSIRMNTSGGYLGKLFAVLALCILLSAGGTSVASAQSYVPVNDADLISDFGNYVNDLFQRWDDTFGAGAPNGTSDNLRDIIAGRDPGGIAKEDCAKGDNLEGNPVPAFPYTDGPWSFAIASSGVANGVPPGATNAGPYVQINYSHSLRCLLMEVVEWQKLSISVQIHSLLKNYIADAQNAQLTKQLKNRLTAANLNFAKGGNQVNNGGVITNSPVFVTNYNQEIYNVNSRQLDAISDQAAADPASGNPQGSLGVCQPWRIDAAADMVRNNRTKVEDPFKYTNTFTKCNLADPADPTSPFATEGAFANYSDNFNDPANKFSGIDSFNHMLQNPQDTPLGAPTLLDQATAGRIAKQEESSKVDVTAQKFKSTKECSGLASDPHCLDDQFSTDISPSGRNEGNVNNLLGRMNDEVTADGLDAQSATSSQAAPTEIDTNTGLLGSNTLPLETSGTAVNELIKEFYDVINFGYFGIHQDTTEWAQGTMLMIYDEMKFNQDLSNGQGGSIVTNGQAEQPTGY
jgi:hypothetical protein